MAEVDCVRPPEYLYPFRSFPGRLLYAGHLPDGQQVLVGPLPPDVLVLKFSPTGELVVAERDALPEQRDRDDLERGVEGCFERIGTVPGTIRVRRFSSANPGSPLAFVEGSDEPSRHVRVELTDLPSEALDGDEERRWLSSGAYVLEWGDSYYVGEDGRVFST